jgi:Tol biopolymer transport system component
MAEYLSVGPEDPHTAMWIRDASENDKLPTMAQLDDPRFFPYRFGQAFWAYVAGRFGDEVVGRILNAGARTGNAEAALQRVLNIPVDSINAEWQEEVRLAYRDVRAATDEPDTYGEVVLSRGDDGSRFNLGPTLSPDGEELVFLSIRDLFSLDMFRANAETGEVLNRLVQSATDPHFESIQFIRSTGAWNAAGDQFVFGAVTGSDPVLTIIDVKTGETLHEKIFPDLGEIFNPTWSPDGSFVAFSAVVGGFSDLYVYDLEGDVLRRLTDDAYADLHPAWSPDGRSIAFVTDRYSTNLARLAYGNYRLAMLDPTTGAIEPVVSFPEAKNINPQWSPDGKSLYFLGNPNGITNAYRLDLTTNQIYQITNLFTGISGITALSPALSVAKDVDKIAFSVYEGGDYNVYVVDSAEVLRGTPVSAKR